MSASTSRISNGGGGGRLQQRAEQLRAEAEAAKRRAALRIARPPADAGEEPESIAGAAGAPVAAQGTQGIGGPAGAGPYVVKPGECLSSIAVDTGHLWETIWNDAGNAALREARSSPNVLLPGDRLVIPAVKPRHERGQTEMRHRFCRRGERTTLNFVVKDADGVPRADEAYVLEIDGRCSQGMTSANGEVHVSIPGNARRGTFTLTRSGETYDLELGHLDPIGAISGIQKRLNNLGFDCGEVDGVCGTVTRAAVRRFQVRHGLPATGECDEATRERLLAEHKC